MVVSIEVNRADQVVAEAITRMVVRSKLQNKPPDPYIMDPVGWVQTRLGAFVWSKQVEILEAVRDNRRTAVHSAHSTGKSWLAARLVCWWLDVHPVGEAFVVTTAPTTPQVRAVLWQEIRSAHRDSDLRGRLNLTEWWFGDQLIAFGRKPSDYSPAAFQGIHAKYVLLIVDEAGGVPKTIFTAGGSLASNEFGRVLAIGNPDDPTSHFAEICKPDSGWRVVRVNGLETPNFTGEPVPDGLRHLLISPLYVEELKRDVGETSPVYVSKALGAFPEDSADGVVPLSWVRACQRLDREYSERDLLPVELGMDVGAGGDETVLRERRGVVAGRTWRYRTPNWEQAVGYAVQAVNECGATRIKVDVIGIGWGVVGGLRAAAAEGRHGAHVVGINVASASTDPKRFPRLRDQLWWEVGREMSRDRGWDLAALDDRTVAQLVAPTWKPDSAGRYQVEPKRDTIARIGRSPDDADALLLAYANPGTGFAALAAEENARRRAVEAGLAPA